MRPSNALTVKKLHLLLFTLQKAMIKTVYPVSANEVLVLLSELIIASLINISWYQN